MTREGNALALRYQDDEQMRLEFRLRKMAFGVACFAVGMGRLSGFEKIM